MPHATDKRLAPSLDVPEKSRLNAVIERSIGLMRRAAASYRLQPAELDELEQDVRVRLWKAAGRTENVEHLSGSYVYRTAISAAVEIVKRRQTERLSTLDDHTVLESRDLSDSSIERDALAAAIQSILGGMVPARATVVRLYLAGYHRDEISDLLGWTEAKTRNLLYRGLEDMRAGLTQRGFP